MDVKFQFPFVANAFFWEVREAILVAVRFDQPAVRRFALKKIIGLDRGGVIASFDEFMHVAEKRGKVVRYLDAVFRFGVLLFATHECYRISTRLTEPTSLIYHSVGLRRRLRFNRWFAVICIRHKPDMMYDGSWFSVPEHSCAYHAFLQTVKTLDQ